MSLQENQDKALKMFENILNKETLQTNILVVALFVLFFEQLKDFIIDDSGMFVHALKGFPGVYSAYGQKTIGNQGILTLMEGIEDRSATFKCCIGCDIDGKTIIVTGKCDGFILNGEKGKEGFGYDPIFSPDGKRSFAEISVEEKNTMSHRGNAVKLLRSELISSGLLDANN